MKKRVLFIIESLGGGGAEKVLSTIVRHIDNEKYDVTVFAVSGGGVYEDAVAETVDYRCLFKKPSRYSGIGKLWYYIIYNMVYHWLPMRLVYKLFVPKGYDVEVAFVEGFATKLLAASMNRNARKIAWVHVDLNERPWTIENRVFANLTEEKEAYGKYDSVVCVSKSVEAVMRNYYGLENTVTRYNPVDADSILRKGREACPIAVDGSKYNIVSVGRLTHEKGYDMLLPIIKRVKERCPDVHLWLIGEGPDGEALKLQAEELGITEDVTFTGFLKNPYSLMAKMDLFVCSSRAEGFSLVIAESMVLGVPVVSMNCSGPNELIGDNEYGVLCDTYEQLEEEILIAVNGKKIAVGIPPIVSLTGSTIVEKF